MHHTRFQAADACNASNRFRSRRASYVCTV